MYVHSFTKMLKPSGYFRIGQMDENLYHTLWNKDLR